MSSSGKYIMICRFVNPLYVVLPSRYKILLCRHVKGSTIDHTYQADSIVTGQNETLNMHFFCWSVASGFISNVESNGFNRTLERRFGFHFNSNFFQSIHHRFQVIYILFQTYTVSTRTSSHVWNRSSLFHTKNTIPIIIVVCN